MVHFEAAAHGRMHHDLTWCLDLLETVQSDIIKVAGAVKVSLLVSHHLFEEAVPAGLTLFLLEQEIIC